MLYDTATELRLVIKELRFMPEWRPLADTFQEPDMKDFPFKIPDSFEVFCLQMLHTNAKVCSTYLTSIVQDVRQLRNLVSALPPFWSLDIERNPDDWNVMITMQERSQEVKTGVDTILRNVDMLDHATRRVIHDIETNGTDTSWLEEVQQNPGVWFTGNWKELETKRLIEKCVHGMIKVLKHLPEDTQADIKQAAEAFAKEYKSSNLSAQDIENRLVEHLSTMSFIDADDFTIQDANTSQQHQTQQPQSAAQVSSQTEVAAVLDENRLVQQENEELKRKLAAVEQELEHVKLEAAKTRPITKWAHDIQNPLDEARVYIENVSELCQDHMVRGAIKHRKGQDYADHVKEVAFLPLLTKPNFSSAQHVEFSTTGLQGEPESSGHDQEH